MVKGTFKVILLLMLVFMSSLTIMVNVKEASNVNTSVSRSLNDVTNVSGSSLDDINPLMIEGSMRERKRFESSQRVEGLHLDILESRDVANASTSPVFSEDFEGAFPEDNWLVGDANSNNDLDYWDDTSYRPHSGSWSGWCAQIGTQTSTSTLFYETFEGAFPGSWIVGDRDPDSGEDYWDDISYRSYEGSWSGWCADIGTKVTTTTIFSEDFEGTWPGSWTVGDSTPESGYDYWGDYYYMYHEGHWSGYCADEGSHPSGCGYDNDMNAYMYRSVSLSGYSSVTLSYWYWLDSESNYDYLYVIYYDGGDWHFIDEHAGNSGGWQYSSVSIPTSATQVGLHFYSDSSVCSYDGAFVDEVQLRGTSEVPNNSVHEYDDNMDAYLYRSVNLAGYSSATLSYRYWLDSESGFDKLYVIYYDGSWHFIDEHTGNSGGWQYSSVSIPTTATEVGLHFISDSSVSSYEGAYIDNIRLTATGNIPNPDLHTYDDYMDTYMVRKYVIDASSWSSATLSYYAWYQTESNLDYLQVIVTDDAGANWYYIGDRLSGTSDWAYHSLDIPSTYFTSQFGIGFMFHSDSSIHDYEGAYLDDINFDVEINHPPIVSEGCVDPPSGYPDTIFTFRVKYTDSDGDPADTKRLILDDDGIFYFDMYHVSGNPIDGEWFEVQVTGLHPDSQVGEHRFFFYFTDGRGGEDYDPDEGWHPGPIVNEPAGEADIRLQYDSLLFEYPESSGCPRVDVSEVEGNGVFGYRVNCTVNFGGLFLETDGNYTVVSSPGCDRIFETGRPILPAKTFYILLPPSAQVTSSKVILCDKVDLRDEYFVQITPSPHILGDSPCDVSTDDLPDPYPKQIVRINGIHEFRGYKLLSVTFFTAQYYPSSHKLFKINKLGMELELRKVDEQGIESLFRGLPEDENAVKRMVVNPEVASLYSDMPSIEITTTYKYIIITSSNLVDAFQPLADWKVQKVGSATIVTVSSITSSYSGRDTQEKIRNFIIDKYTNWGTEWILLGGDVEVVPYRGAYGYVLSTEGPVEDRNIPCDLYYSDLNGDWDADGDSIFGEVSDNVDLYPDVYVGRAPVNTASEATVFVNKVLTYEQNPPLGYLSNALMIAYWLDENTNEAVLKDYITNNYLVEYTTTKIYEASFGAGVDKTAVINSLNSGQGIVNHASHANYWTTPPLDRADVDGLNNGEKYFIFYSMGCLTNKFEEADSISEHYILNSHGGAVAYIGNSRYGWYWPEHPGEGTSDKYDKEFFKCLHDGYNHIGDTLARSKITFIPQSGTDGAKRWVQYCLNLLGDPEMTIRTEANPSKPDTVYNDGTADLEVYDIRDCYTAGEPSGWLSASPTAFIVPPDGSQVVIVAVNPTGLDPGTYHGWLEIDSNDPDENPYIVSVTLTVKEISHTITFYTNPVADPPSITFDGATYTHGQSGSYSSGDYSATANPPSVDYAFHHWDYSGSLGSGVYVPNININPTTVQVRGDGWLKAIFSAKITFHINPAGIGSITYDGGTFTDGDFIWEVNLLPDYGNIRTIHANVPTGYIFVNWGTTGKIYVSDPSSISTTLTVDGPGVLTANFEAINQPPSILDIYPDSENESQGNIIRIYCDSSDPETPESSLICNIWIRPSGDSWVVSGETMSWDGSNHYYDWNIPTSAKLGYYDVNCTVSDGELSDWRTDYNEFKVIDTTPPVVQITDPTTSSPIYTQSGTTLTANYTYTELNPKNATIKVHNTTHIIGEIVVTDLIPGVGVTRSDSLNIAAWATHGEYNVTVTINDIAEQTGIDTQTNAVIIDNTPPVVNICYPAEGQYIDMVPIIWINGTITETNTGSNLPVINDTEAFDLHHFHPATGEFAFYNITVIPDCTHSYRINFTDLAGNTGNGTVTFTIDTVYPVVEITYPADRAHLDGVAVIWINGTFTEKNFNTTKLLDINHTGFALADWTWNLTTYEGTFAFWNTSVIPDGTYSVEVWITDLAGKTGFDIVTFTFSSGVHDIAVINIEVSKTVVGQNYSISINVTVENQGNFTESFNVTAKYNTTLINTTEVTLTSGNSTIVTFTWNTTDVAKGNYTITAKATPLPGETDTADNTYIDGWVVVTIPGDLDADGDVDPDDLDIFAGAYGTSPLSNPNCDIDSDGDVDPCDFYIISRNYGKTDA